MKKNLIFLVTIGLVTIYSQVCFSQGTDLKTLDEIGLKTAFAHDDSGKAVINLFYRKRESAGWRGIIGAGLVGYSTYAASIDSYPGSYFVGPVLFSPLYITSITSTVKYRQKNLLTVLQNRQNGGTIPHKYRKKLRKKDFRS